MEDVCGVAQLCSGLRAGMEGAIHAVRELFDLHSDDGWGVLLVDARNAFNSVNRVAALWNARVLWPRCSRFLFNSYRGYARLLIQGSDQFLLSKEGVTQGDPLSMMLYAVAVLPLIRSLEDSCEWVQNWYADDSSCVGELSSVRRWFDKLLIGGPAYGYFPEPSKTVLVVGSSDLERASDLFRDLGISVVTGSRFLGGFVGERSLAADFVSNKVRVWCECIQSLSDVAISEPQASFAALARSLQFEWNHIQRVIPECGTLFAPLLHAINSIFYPSLFGGTVSENEIALFSLPTRFGGLGITNCVESASLAFRSSREGSVLLVDAIIHHEDVRLTDHLAHLDAVHSDVTKDREDQFRLLLSSLLPGLPSLTSRAVQRAVDSHTSGWLNVLPLAHHHFDLSAQQFRDALCLRYHRPLSLLPASCDGCGGDFSLTHALDCRKGGLVTQRHNEVRDALGDLAALGYREVVREPIVCDGDNDSPALIADLGVRGVWIPQGEALFDVRVVDTDAASYVNRSVSAVLASAEEEKKRKYLSAAELRHASFTPFVVSVDGALGHGALMFLQRLADRLSSAWGKSYGHVLMWIKVRLAFAVVRATNLCFRGSRVRWRSGSGIDDGAGLPYVSLT